MVKGENCQLGWEGRVCGLDFDITIEGRIIGLSYNAGGLLRLKCECVRDSSETELIILSHIYLSVYTSSRLLRIPECQWCLPGHDRRSFHDEGAATAIRLSRKD